MPILQTEMAKRLVRWQLSHTAPAPLALEHPVQEDLAAAADEIERLNVALSTTQDVGRDAALLARAETALTAALNMVEGDGMPPDWDYLRLVRMQLRVLRATPKDAGGWQAREAAAKVAEAEPECPDTPTPEMLHEFASVGAVEVARAAVRATKKSIAAAIRALPAPPATATATATPQGEGE